MTHTNIVVKLQIEGFHYWKDAPKEVSFLRDNHRHIFHFEIEKEVKHDDRDIEIILFKRKVETYVREKYKDADGVCQFESKSCEMLAKEVMLKFGAKVVRVLEDNENGAAVYW